MENMAGAETADGGAVVAHAAQITATSVAAIDRFKTGQIVMGRSGYGIRRR
jgi:hypothetical protein